MYMIMRMVISMFIGEKLGNQFYIKRRGQNINGRPSQAFQVLPFHVRSRSIAPHPGGFLCEHYGKKRAPDKAPFHYI
jgi:hypothetical protein